MEKPDPPSKTPFHSLMADEILTLIPGLPNDLASLCLAFLPYSHHSRLKSTCKSWRIALSSKFLLDLRQKWRKSEELLCIFREDPSLTPGALFSPRSHSWCPIPPMPCDPYRYGLSNFAAVSVDSKLFVIGGSLFDARSFPINLPLPSPSVYCLDLTSLSWNRRSQMMQPRGSFACASIHGGIVVAGGGSRHAQFGAGGSRMRSVERYDVEKDVWFGEEELPGVRAGSVGFLVGDEFWIMGGYGVCRTISRVFPVDEYYRDGVVLGLKSRKWRKIEPMWEEDERWRLGPVVVIEGDEGELPGIFMLDGSVIFRFNIASNRWYRESDLPRKNPNNSTCGFVALDGELHVMSGFCSMKPKHKKKTLVIQAYNPKKKTWRFQFTKPPFQNFLDFKCAVLCTVRL